MYKITEWGADVIEATYTYLCRREDLKLNFKTKKFFKIVTDTGNCPEAPKLEKARVLEIINGKKIIFQELGKMITESRDINVLAHDFHKVINNLLTKEEREIGSFRMAKFY